MTYLWGSAAKISGHTDTETPKVNSHNDCPKDIADCNPNDYAIIIIVNYVAWGEIPPGKPLLSQLPCPPASAATAMITIYYSAYNIIDTTVPELLKTRVMPHTWFDRYNAVNIYPDQPILLRHDLAHCLLILIIIIIVETYIKVSNMEKNKILVGGSKI